METEPLTEAPPRVVWTGEAKDITHWLTECPELQKTELDIIRRWVRYAQQ